MRNWVRTLRLSAERRIGFHAVRRGYHGLSDCADILRSGIDVRTVFDVGANVGGIAREYLRWFPNSMVHCFEPAPSTFRRLEANLGRHPRVRLHPEALGSMPGRAKMFVGDNDLTNSMAHARPGAQEIEVPVITLDWFMERHSIASVDLLKVDAEGFDLEVLRGGAAALSSGRVRFALVEVTPNQGIERHVHLDEVRTFLEPMGFRLYGLYDQVLAWDGRPMVQFANALFRLQPS